MSSNSRLDTAIALRITKILPTYLTNFVTYPGASIISFMTGLDANFGDKTSLDGIRHPEEEVLVSSEIEYQYKYARKHARRMDMPSLTQAIMIDEEYYAGDLVNAMGHIQDLGQNFIEGINRFAFEGSLKPLMYGIEDILGGTAGTRERPEQVAAVTAAGKWDVATSIPATLNDMQSALIDKKFYGPPLVLAHPLVKPMLSQVLTNTAVAVGVWMQSAFGFPIIFSPWIDNDSTVSASDVYMVDSSKFAYTMTPLRIKSYFDDHTDQWVWKWQTRFVLRPSPLLDTVPATDEWLKGVVKSTVDCNA